MIQHTISYLIRALGIVKGPVEPPEPPTLITYKIASDLGDRLEQGARTACNFWNRYLQPKQSIVIRLGVFTENSNTIAQAYLPFEKDGTAYGRVEFNTKYLGRFSEDEIAGTIVHEIGHTLGIGWEQWKALFVRETGRFRPDAVEKLAALEAMEVEREGGHGTAYSHWDEERFGKELMTGWQNEGEHVLPVTIEVMGLLGHELKRTLAGRTPLPDLLHQAKSVIFSRQAEARTLDRDYLEETEVFEAIPYAPPKG
jgi:hypothetical protein